MRKMFLYKQFCENIAPLLPSYTNLTQGTAPLQEKLQMSDMLIWTILIELFKHDTNFVEEMPAPLDGKKYDGWEQLGWMGTWK